MRQKILVGFAREDITPQEYTTLAGYGNDHMRMCNYILDRIYGTCIALQDENGETLLLCAVDMLNAVKHTVVDGARKAIHEATGVPVDHISVSVSHTHAGPSMYSWEDERTNRFLTYYCKQMAKAAVAAIQDLAEAEISIGQRIVPNMTFVRHYIANDGSYCGVNFGSWKSGVKCHADVADEQLQVMHFARKDARDVVLVNWQCHATDTGANTATGGTDTKMSADYPGAMRNHLEGLTGCHCAFFQGACGNQIPNSSIRSEMVIENYNHVAYGKAMAENVAACLKENMHPAKAGPLKTVRQIYNAPVDHSDDHLVEKAKEALAGVFEFDTAAGRREHMLKFGFNSHLHASSIVNRSRAGESMEMELNAFAIGDISFATAPFEMFNSNGRYVKDNTPFAMTFMMAYSNGSFSYLADEKAFGYDCYEVNNRNFPKGTAEGVATNLTEMLKEIAD